MAAPKDNGVPLKGKEEKTEKKMEETKVEEKVEKKEEVKTEEKEEKKTPTKKKDIVKKDKAIANGFSLRISSKDAVAICKVIRGKSPRAAVKRLEDVIAMKRVIPMANL